jgi:hypothetical protein
MFNRLEYLSIEQYLQAAEAFHTLSPMLLFEFARFEELRKRDLIARNFIARADMMVRGIF